MFDDDFSGFCGEFADLDGDGKVSLYEYLNEEDDYNRIMGGDNEDDEEDGYSLDDEDDDEDGCGYLPEDDDTENYGRRKIEIPLTFLSGFEDCDEDVIHRPEHCRTIEEYYYDTVYDRYHIAEAVYDNFLTESQNFKKREVAEDVEDIIRKVYMSDKKVGLGILLWMVKNFPKAFRGAKCNMPRFEFRANTIIGSMADRDNSTGDDVVMKYIYEHPEFEKSVLGEQHCDSEPFWYVGHYIPYLINKNNAERVISSYKTFCRNPNLDKNEYPKEEFLDDILVNLLIEDVRYADKRLYNFFKAEIESIGKPIKINYLMEKLNSKEYSETIFSKTYAEKTEPAQKQKENITEPIDTVPMQGSSDDFEDDNSDDVGIEDDEAYQLLLAKIDSLEERLEDADKRIAFLERELGVNTAVRKAAETDKPYAPKTTPQNGTDTFVYAFTASGVEYADDSSVCNVSVGDTVLLSPEPDNKYDRHAIKVLDIRGYKLGYVPRWANRYISKKIDFAGVYGVVSKADADESVIAVDVWQSAD